MDFRKAQLLLTSLLILTGFSSALVFELSVDQDLKYNTQDLRFDESVDTLQNLNLSVTNTGSVGCNFRLKASYNRSDRKITRYSDSHALWPGQEARFVTYYIPEEPGEKTANLSLRTCRGWEEIQQVNFSVQNASSAPEEKLDYVKTGAEKGEVNIEVGLEDGLAVPQETPPYWKAGSVPIKNGSANLTYTPEMYRGTENISYRIVNKTSKSVLGGVEVSVVEKKSFLEKITVLHVSVALMISLLLNIVLIARKHLSLELFRS